MKRLRQLGFVLWLALALAIGQQAALLHGLGHAAERLAQTQQSDVPPAKCELHFACSQIAGAVGIAPPVIAFLAATPPRPAVLCDRSARIAPRLAFHSRAPPVSLA